MLNFILPQVVVCLNFSISILLTKKLTLLTGNNADLQIFNMENYSCQNWWNRRISYTDFLLPSALATKTNPIELRKGSRGRKDPRMGYFKNLQISREEEGIQISRRTTPHSHRPRPSFESEEDDWNDYKNEELLRDKREEELYGSN